MTHSKKPVAVAMGTALAGGLLLSGSAFSVTPLSQGYLLSAHDAAAAAKAGEGKCGEGKCGIAHLDTDKDGKVSPAEFAAKHPDKADKFASIDGNGDGFIDRAEYDAHKAARKTEKKADAEGKCGEGKCGEGKCGGMA